MRTPEPRADFPADLVYEISVARGHEGRLVALTRGCQPVAPREFQQRRCWEHLAGASEPCRGCPVFGVATSGGIAPPPIAGTEYGVIRVLARDARRARVAIHWVTDLELGELIIEKLSRLAAAARLSAKEKVVLRLTAEGQQVKEIAAWMKISPRTVKFHGENLLRKLGIRTRLELLGLLHPAGSRALSARAR